MTAAWLAGHIPGRDSSRGTRSEWILHDVGYAVLALIALALVGLAVWYVFRRRR